MATQHQQHRVAWPRGGSAVYRTDLNGDVTVTTDGMTYDVKTGQVSSQPIAGIAKTVTTQQAVSPQSSAYTQKVLSTFALQPTKSPSQEMTKKKGVFTSVFRWTLN